MIECHVCHPMTRSRRQRLKRIPQRPMLPKKRQFLPMTGLKKENIILLLKSRVMLGGLEKADRCLIQGSLLLVKIGSKRRAETQELVQNDRSRPR
ncbi:unnamed protein product [Heligmosomoides polygyrus]|uniref:Uncharacterized protein n=1 Tax=Heligmosomoides polygyrus TaxID=6339 RepID=A0A183FA21_HELPZ|nr:unnamed protein product [Heligmosomoides polygyrus]